MTADEIAAAHPEAAAALRDQGATAARERIQAVEGQTIPGHEALIATLKFDGKSNAGDAAMAVNAAERTARAAHASAMANDAPPPLAQAPASTVAPVEKKALSKAEVDSQAKAHMAANPGVDYITAVKHVQQQGA